MNWKDQIKLPKEYILNTTMKDLIIEVKKEKTITYEYSYEFIDSKQIKVRVEGIKNKEDLDKSIKSKTRQLSKTYNIKTIEV